MSCDFVYINSTCFHHFNHSFLFPPTMRPTSSQQKASVISLLEEGYSLHHIQSKTGLGKPTIGRIKKEVDGDKENNKGGCPSKLSPADK